MEDGIVLLKNESLLPLNETKKLNIFGWESINPAYGGAGSVELMICMILSV